MENRLFIENEEQWNDCLSMVCLGQKLFRKGNHRMDIINWWLPRINNKEPNMINYMFIQFLLMEFFLLGFLLRTTKHKNILNATRQRDAFVTFNIV